MSRGPKSVINLITGLPIKNVNTCRLEGIFFSIDFFLNILILMTSDGNKHSKIFYRRCC